MLKWFRRPLLPLESPSLRKQAVHPEAGFPARNQVHVPNPLDQAPQAARMSARLQPDQFSVLPGSSSSTPPLESAAATVLTVDTTQEDATSNQALAMDHESIGREEEVSPTVPFQVVEPSALRRLQHMWFLHWCLFQT